MQKSFTNQPIHRVERKTVTDEEIEAKREQLIMNEAKKTIAMSEFDERKKQYKDNLKLYCQLCKITCYSRSFYEKHINGKKHQDAEEKDFWDKHNGTTSKDTTTKTTSTPPQTVNGKKHCKHCDIEVSTTNWSKHEKSAKHISKVKGIEIQCQPCGSIFSSEATYLRHCKSRKHRLKCNEGPDDIEENTNGGSLFMVTFSGAVKYEIAKKLKNHYCAVCNGRFATKAELQRHSQGRRHRILNKQYGNYQSVKEREQKFKESIFIESYAIGNEYGVSEDSSHCHAVFKTNEKLTFEMFKIKFKEFFGASITIRDIERVRNIKQSIRYVTKEDANSLVNGFDKTLGSVLYKAGLYARHHNKVDWSNPVAASISLSDRKIFEAYVTVENLFKSKVDLTKKFHDCTLRPWQTTIINEIFNTIGDDRKVIWVHDSLGNSGKTFLASYLSVMHKGITFSNTQEKDVAYAYNSEPIVIFDFSRSTSLDNISFACIEQLKNGTLFSNKYESTVKIFKPPAVICLSNTLPARDKLSIDRWIMYSYHGNEELERMKCFNSVTICTNTHICNNK